MKTKLVIEVMGGIVQTVYADAPGQVEVEVVDHDDRDFRKADENRKRIREAEATMTKVY